MRAEAAAPTPTAQDVLTAARRVREVVRVTPLEPSAALSEAAETEVWVKLENLQRTGSFKLRGACNAVLALSAAERAHGLVTASAGNHGLGVAYAARLSGTQAAVFVPADAARAKRERIARLGAVLREVPGSYEEAHAEALRYAEQNGARYVHAFSDPAVVAGQGTVGLEILQALPEVRTLLVPVGGGGLIGGIGIIARALSPTTRVVGVQSEATAAMYASLRAGRVESPPMPATLCDGLSGEIDERSLALAQQVVDEVVLVTERAVRQSIGTLYAEEGMVVEGSAAVVAAALWERVLPRLAGPVAAVVTGANIDAPVLAEILMKPR